ncbi:MAG: hypothetical protein Q8N57_01620 [bacterium]|nr:hypothetical protein [bacterium]
MKEPINDNLIMKSQKPDGHSKNHDQIIWEPFLIESRKFAKFLEVRDIKPEDYALINGLAKLSKDSFSTMHNFFSGFKEKSLGELEARQKSLRNTLREKETDDIQSWKKLQYEENLKCCELFIPFLEKYGWDACWHLNCILESENRDKRVEK